MSTARITGYRTPAAIRSMLALLGGIVAVALVLGGAWTLLDLSSRHTFDVQHTYAGVHSLTVHSEGGDIRLTSAPAGSNVTVVEHVTEGLSKPRRSARRIGGSLVLDASCSTIFSSQCGVDYEVAVPAGIPVSIDSGAGNVTATGLSTTASIDLSSGAGDVVAERTSAPNVTLHSGAGDVTAQFTRPPVVVNADSGAGDVTLIVPDVSYAVRASSGAGTVSDQAIRIDPASSRTIRASSGAGDVTIALNR